MNTRKVLCLLLALTMVLVLSGSSFANGLSTEGKAEVEIPGDLPEFKIGCLGVFSGSELYIQWKNNLQTLEEKFNVSFQFLDSQGPDDVENMCIAGVNGIIMQGCSESILQITEKYNVPLAVYCMQFSEEELAVFSQYKTFLGVVTEEDGLGAIAAAEAMFDAGCRNVAVAGLTRGIALNIDSRCENFIARFKELGGKIIAEDYTMMAFADSISSFAAAYPEMDGVFSAFLNEGVFQSFSTEGLVGDVKLASFDLTENCISFLNNGTMVFTACGQQGTIMAAFAVLYNYLYNGTYLIPDRSEMVIRNWITVCSAEDAADFNEYIRFSAIYSPEEIAYMIVGFNPDFTFEQFKDIQTAYSIAEVKARAEK